MSAEKQGTVNLRHLCLILTTQCNFACAYCYQNSKNSSRMARKTARKAIDTALKTGERRTDILFTGGEPLLEYEMIREAVRYTKESAPQGKSVTFSISTNGILVDESVAAFLANNRFDTQLSFDGIPKAQDRRSSGSFNKLDKLIDSLIRDFPDFFSRRLSISCTLTPDSIENLAGSIEYFLKKGIRNIKIAPSITTPKDLPDGLEEELDIQLNAVFESCLKHYQGTGAVPLNIFRGKFGDDACCKGKETICGAALAHSIAVDVDGQVFGCPVFAGSYQEFSTPLLANCSASLSAGMIDSPVFFSRLASLPGSAETLEIFHDKRRKHSSYSRCSDCPYLSQCTFCPASIAHIPGNSDPNRVPDFPCAFNRIAMKYRALFPVQPDPRKMIEGPPGVEEEIRFWRELSEKTSRPEQSE